MAPKPIPEGFHTITPYLISKGAARLIDFMKQAFGAEELYRFPMPDGSITHATVRIGDSMLELSDGAPEWPPRAAAIHLYVPDADAVFQRALQAGGTSVEEPVDQPYGDRESGVKDPCGNFWWIATHKAAGAGTFMPPGFRTLTPGLSVVGAAQLIEFLRRALGAEVVSSHTAPNGTVAHAELRFGDSIVELSEAHGQWKPLQSTIHLYVEDTDALYQRAMQAGAKSLREVRNEFYGDRTGGVEDPAGNQWWIATHVEDVPSEELGRRASAMKQHAG